MRPVSLASTHLSQKHMDKLAAQTSSVCLTSYIQVKLISLALDRHRLDLLLQRHALQEEVPVLQHRGYCRLVALILNDVFRSEVSLFEAQGTEYCFSPGPYRSMGVHRTSKTLMHRNFCGSLAKSHAGGSCPRCDTTFLKGPKGGPYDPTACYRYPGLGNKYLVGDLHWQRILRWLKLFRSTPSKSRTPNSRASLHRSSLLHFLTAAPC
jgi:hypothetical protein